MGDVTDTFTVVRRGDTVKEHHFFYEASTVLI